MKFYSYVVKHDNGSAPNPYWNYCTLAICKPRIRRVAKEGDWVIGTGSKKNVGNNRLIYAMKVTKVMRLEDYGTDKQFVCKIPVDEDEKTRVGDNMYYRDDNGEIKQRFPSIHSYRNRENPETKHTDLSGENVLLSETGSFWYFGRNAPELPESFMCLVKKGPGHKCDFQPDLIHDFLKWIEQKKPAIHGTPCDDYSNQQTALAQKQRKSKSKTCN